MRKQLIFVNLVRKYTWLRWCKFFLVILFPQSSSQREGFHSSDLRHILEMNVYIVFDVREGVLDRVLIELNICDILMNLHLWHLRNRYQEIGEKFELCFELVFLPDLISGSIQMLNASLNWTQDDCLEGSRLHILMMIEFIENVEWYDTLALRQ